jgi:hypothetical protein
LSAALGLPFLATLVKASGRTRAQHRGQGSRPTSELKGALLGPSPWLPVVSAEKWRTLRKELG